jgi:hypothetical protein
MSGSTAVASLSALNNWPGTVAQWQQRLVFGGSYQNPSGIWLTQPGNYYNMNVSVPVRDSDAITQTITAPPPGAGVQVNEISSVVPMPSGLLVFTSGGAWQISGGQPNAAVTPGSITAQAQAFSGASPNVQPVPIGYQVLYCGVNGATVRDLSYNFYANVFTGNDLSALADHLFFGRSIVDWCWAEEPWKLVWVVRDDGVLLSMTYLKEQNLFAWAHHDTQGVVESVASVVEDGQSRVYMVVKRFLNGGWTRCVERLALRDFGANPAQDIPPDPALAWCVDCGLSYPRPLPAATLSPEASTGSGVSFEADADVFGVDDVGKVIRAGGGRATVVEYVSPREVLADITAPILAVIPGDASARPIPAGQGYWSLTMPTSTVSGLNHLEGLEVAVLADGNASTATVVGGRITLGSPATNVIVGLNFTWEVGTLPISIAGQPTLRGRRKMVNSVTVLMQDARGVSIGPALDSLTPMQDRAAQGLENAQAAPLVSGEIRTNIGSQWTPYGQVWLSGSEPVPATILAVAGEWVMGDTG